MNYKQAKRLHNHDEITIKATKEIVKVISIENIPEFKRVIIYATVAGTFTQLIHTEIS